MELVAPRRCYSVESGKREIGYKEYQKSGYQNADTGQGERVSHSERRAFSNDLVQ